MSTVRKFSTYNEVLLLASLMLLLILAESKDLDSLLSSVIGFSQTFIEDTSFFWELQLYLHNGVLIMLVYTQEQICDADALGRMCNIPHEGQSVLCSNNKIDDIQDQWILYLGIML